MPNPNIGTANVLVGAAKVSAATPPIVTNAVGISGVTRTGAGIWVVTIVEPADFTNRFVTLTSFFATHGVLELDPAVQTDVTIGVLGFLLAVASDLAWEIKVERVSLP
ncbi:MAG TPA: hypothetical protein ENI05_11265 [Porticoccus sp.]|nr:hypothetical protein [Porticoccus sp.]